MNQSIYCRIKKTHFCNLLMPSVSAALVPLYILATCADGNAEDLRNTAASVNFLREPVTFLIKGKRAISADLSTRLQGGDRRLIVDRGGEAGLGFVEILNTREEAPLFSARILYYALADRLPVEYKYPCRGRGTFTIGWLEGNQRGDCDDVATVGPPTRWSGRKNLLKAEVSDNIIRYCSAVANSGQGWGAIVSNSPWDILSTKDPCEQAVQKCEELSFGSSCSLINMGEQDITEPDEQFTAVLKCANQAFPSPKGKLTSLQNWLSARSENSNFRSSSCSLHVLSFDEFLVFPTTNETTVIQTRLNTSVAPNGRFEIVIIAGKVTIVSADPNLDPSRLEARQICIPSNEVEACLTSNRDLDLNTRQQIYESPHVQGFINPDKWSSYLEPDIQRYRNAVQQQFFPQELETPPEPETPPELETPPEPETPPELEIF
ncbi:MAG: hypothetical protein F6K14_11120 [Symploca sp. SIO2C1]|nr:hypothetical protein [Symploca sp. SIO2C1]